MVEEEEGQEVVSALIIGCSLSEVDLGERRASMCTEVNIGEREDG
jgi:hypothetical protein